MILSLQNFKCLLIHLLSLFLLILEIFPKYGNTILSSNFEAAVKNRFLKQIVKNRFLSAINTGTYKWATFFVPLLETFTSNNYTVKDSFDFAKDISQKRSKLFMASLDVDSFFTNLPLDEIIEICINELLKPSQTVSGLSKQQVLAMLSLTTKENVILFDQKYYSQIDGAIMAVH